MTRRKLTLTRASGAGAAGIGAAGAATLALGSGPFSPAACTPHLCDPSTVDAGPVYDNGGGWLPPPCPPESGCTTLEWYSSASTGAWFPFNANETLNLALGPLPPLPAGVHPDFNYAWGEVLIAAIPPPTGLPIVDPALPADARTDFVNGPFLGTEGDANFIPGTGQLDQFVRSISPDSVSVFNASCATYAIQVRVQVPLVADAPSQSAAPTEVASALDSGAPPATAGSSDAGATE